MAPAIYFAGTVAENTLFEELGLAGTSVLGLGYELSIGEYHSKTYSGRARKPGVLPK